MGKQIRKDILGLAMAGVMIVYVLGAHLSLLFFWSSNQLENVKLSFFTFYLFHESSAFGMYLILMNDKIFNLIFDQKNSKIGQVFWLVLGGGMVVGATYRWGMSLPPYFGNEYTLYVILFWAIASSTLAIKGVHLNLKCQDNYHKEKSGLNIWDVVSIIMAAIFIYYIIDVLLIMYSVGVI